MPRANRHTSLSDDSCTSRSLAADDARQRILHAAKRHLSERGYEHVSLSDVADEVGLTRGAVLYHFGSKAELMSALIRPYVDRLDTELDRFEAGSTPPRPRTVLASVLDAFLDNRPAADVMTRDVSGRLALDLDEWMRVTVRRLIRLIAPVEIHGDVAEVRGLAALGALVRPLAALPDPLPPAYRTAILDAAVNTLQRPRRH